MYASDRAFARKRMSDRDGLFFGKSRQFVLGPGNMYATACEDDGTLGVGE
jgi:hypothetical protein